MEFIPYALPMIGQEEIAEVVDTLESGWLTTGKKTKDFETQFADYKNIRNEILIEIVSDQIEKDS